MTDMRATERLLEVIEEVASHEATTKPTESLPSHAILDAVRELRRRGDTLVRAEDLRLVAAAAHHGKLHGPLGDTDYSAFDAALERIESALGSSL